MQLTVIDEICTDDNIKGFGTECLYFLRSPHSSSTTRRREAIATVALAKADCCNASSAGPCNSVATASFAP